MYCKHCGALQNDDTAVCTNCNAPLKDVAQSQPNEAAQAQQTNASYQQPQQGYNPPPSYNQPQQGGSFPPTGFDPPPQQGYTPQPPHSAINSWMVPNIIVTVVSLCCCQIGLVTGIIGIILGAMVPGKEQQGDIAGAAKNANIAKIMFFVSIGLAVLGLILNIVLFASGALVEIMEEIYNPYYGW